MLTLTLLNMVLLAQVQREEILASQTQVLCFQLSRRRDAVYARRAGAFRAKAELPVLPAALADHLELASIAVERGLLPRERLPAPDRYIHVL
jgi:hypothetical protein